jgi:DNA-binding PucR family transcriptional regulator
VSLVDLGLLAAVVSEPEVGDALVRRHLDPLSESRSSGPELEQSHRGYLAAGMSVELAARELVLHHNTLRYRLKRVQELSGVDLRDTASVVELWWALERRRVRPVIWGAWTD